MYKIKVIVYYIQALKKSLHFIGILGQIHYELYIIFKVL